MRAHVAQKLERIEHVNALLKSIGSTGRGFFKNKERDIYAHFLIINSRLWFKDDYRGALIFMGRTGFRNSWRGFSHGGTLRSLVEHLAEYIADGTPISGEFIGLPRRSEVLCETNIWGYPPADLAQLRAEVLGMPIFIQETT